MNKLFIQKLKNNKNKTGFTLVELLFAMAILGIMLTIAMLTFIGVFRFYNWANVTRKTQAASRQVMDDMSRKIQNSRIIFASGSTICLNDVTVSGSDPQFAQISLNSGRIVETLHTKNMSTGVIDCSGPVVNTVVLSATDVSINSLNFTEVFGAAGGAGTIIDPNIQAALQKSVVINMTSVNGTATDGACTPGDNFCDVAVFTTAVTARQTGN